MKKSETVRFEMLSRILEFWKTHRAFFPDSSASGRTFAEVAEAAAAIEAHAMTKMVAAKDGRASRVLARAALTEAMVDIARSARRLPKTASEVASKLRMPARKSDVTLVTTGRVFVGEAKKVKGELEELSLPPTFIDDLEGKVNAFEAAIDNRHAGRSGVAASQEGIRKAIARGLAAARRLDVIVANTLKGDSVRLAAWKRDRRVMLDSSKGQPTVGTTPISTTVPLAPAGTPAELAKKAS